MQSEIRYAWWLTFTLVGSALGCGSGNPKDDPPKGVSRSKTDLPREPVPAPVPREPTSQAHRFVLSATHACFLTADGTAHCWGGNQFSELGRSDIAEEPLAHVLDPKPVETEHRFQSLSGGFFHTCGVDESKRAFCWGQNSFLQIRDAPRTPVTRPEPLQSANLRQVATGSEHTCALDSAGKVHCRGSNQYNQLGERLGASLKWAHRIFWLAAGRHHNCAIDTQDKVMCWGDNVDGQLGKAPSSSQAKPHQLGTLSEIESLRCGSRHCCALQQPKEGESRAYCWGSNQSGQLGRPTTAGFSTIQQVPETMLKAGDSWAQIEPGGRFTCGRSNLGSIYCWGDNHDFVLGSEEELEQLPRQIPLPGKAMELAVGPRTVCAWVSEDELPALYCWGANRRGLLGLEPDDPMATPQRVPVLDGLYSP